MIAAPLRKLHPVTAALLAEVPTATPESVAAMVARAHAAQAAWAALPTAVRGRALRRLAGAIAAAAEELAQLIAQETGKPRVEALLQEVLSVAHLASYFGRNAARILRPRRVPVSLFVQRRSYLHYVPRGVVAVISPWNFPLALSFGDVIMALCAGNAAVLKPSEHTPLTALRLPALLAAADIDPALLQVAVGAGDIGTALLHADVQMVHFTGSTATGRRVAALCGERLIPCVTELGGKDAAVVLEDADVEHTARALVYGAFLNAGQACASVERVYAVGAVYAPLVARLRALTAALRQGDGSAEDVDIGPMITPAQGELVRQQLAAARAGGADLGDVVPRPPPFVAPCVLTAVDDTMAICRDETFGPVLPVLPVATAAAAVARANASAYGLSAYVFTRDIARGCRLAESLQAGTVMVNDVLITHALPETPWGGLKSSGVGTTHGDDGVRNMCETRHVNYPRLAHFPNPWMFPYRQALLQPVGDILRGLYGPWPLWRRVGLLCRGLCRAAVALRRPVTPPAR